MAVEDVDKAEVHHHQMEPHDKIPDFENRQIIHPFEEIICIPEAIEKLLGNLNENKSSGPDGMHPKVLKELRKNISVPLANIFNKSLLEGKVPQAWKEANITAIYKKGPKSDPSNYRPKMEDKDLDECRWCDLDSLDPSSLDIEDSVQPVKQPLSSSEDRDINIDDYVPEVEDSSGNKGDSPVNNTQNGPCRLDSQVIYVRDPQLERNQLQGQNTQQGRYAEVQPKTPTEEQDINIDDYVPEVEDSSGNKGDSPVNNTQNGPCRLDSQVIYVRDPQLERNQLQGQNTQQGRYAEVQPKTPTEGQVTAVIETKEVDSMIKRYVRTREYGFTEDVIAVLTQYLMDNELELPSEEDFKLKWQTMRGSKGIDINIDDYVPEVEDSSGNKGDSPTQNGPCRLDSQVIYVRDPQLERNQLQGQNTQQGRYAEVQPKTPTEGQG
ncbi:uncharacterized protein LOC117332353 [Pecten maximus]|uniref:uncharacterized protein LOC117332353 n=1 Tax=Pecten maximus TaxID=6579 RepID=UPI0014586F5D|nr:uncharacterized protein LOC117332353 [Pecten maximus]